MNNKEFLKYIKEQRNNFVKITEKYDVTNNLELSTEIDDMLIAYDQMNYYIMKQKTNILAQFKQRILSIIVTRLLFPIKFKKIPKKQFGRCVTCQAYKMCHKYNVCKCTDDEQYEVRFNMGEPLLIQ